MKTDHMFLGWCGDNDPKKAVCAHAYALTFNGSKLFHNQGDDCSPHFIDDQISIYISTGQLSSSLVTLTDTEGKIQRHNGTELNTKGLIVQDHF